MKICKKILHLSLFFACCVPFLAAAATFNAIDLDRLLQNHPLMKQFDPSTGRFRNTPSEPQSPAKLELKLQEISTEIDNHLNAKTERLQLMMRDSSSNTSSEEDSWAFLAERDQKIAQLKIEVAKLENLLAGNGVPGFETILEIAGHIASETLSRLTDEDCIVLNRLPRTLLSEVPQFPKQSIRHFFWTKKVEVLSKYLEHSRLIGNIFECIDRPIVYKRTNERSQEK